MDSSIPWRRLPPDAPAAQPTALPCDSIIELQIPPNDGVPNHPRWAALLYPGALADDLDIDRIKALFERNGWFRVRDWAEFDHHHIHPTASEVLAVACGNASITSGGCAGSTRLAS